MLYFVPTPVGNLKDITYRAVEVLSAADVIACEDTRHSVLLLGRYGIRKPLISYHKHNEREASEKIAEMLLGGKNVAVISDAGSPGISDPGGELVKLCVERGLEFTYLPGPNAFVPALVMSGESASRFCFIGFLPEKKSERERLLEAYAMLDCTLVVYAAPHDLSFVISELYRLLGERRACAVREISKIHEECVRFNLSEGYPAEPRGEFVLVVEGARPVKNADPLELIKTNVKLGLSLMDSVKAAAKELGVPKNELYKLAVENKDKLE